MNNKENENTFATGASKTSLPRLTIVEGKDKGKSFLISKNQSIIGRSPDTDIFIDDKNISRNHAKITHLSGTFFIHDNGSTNGTFVNEKKIIETSLKDSDTVRVGDTFLLFEYEKAKGASAPLSPAFDKPSDAPDLFSKSLLTPKRVRIFGLGALLLIIVVFGTLNHKKNKTSKAGAGKTKPVATLNLEELELKNKDIAPIPKRIDSDPAVFYSQGLLAMMSGNYKQAIDLFNQTLEADPQHEVASVKIKKCKELLKKQIDELYQAGVREYEILYYDRAILQWSKVVTLAKDFDNTIYTKTKERIKEAKKRKKAMTQR